MESNYTQLRADRDHAGDTLRRAEKTLGGLKAQSVDLAEKHDNASAALVVVRAERAQKPDAAHLHARVTAAANQLEGLQDATELNLRSIEQAYAATAQARHDLANAEAALAPVQAAHDQAMQAAWDAKRQAYNQAVPLVRKLVALFGNDTLEAVAAIVKANCTNSLSEKFPEYPGPGSIFQQIAAVQAARIQ